MITGTGVDIVEVQRFASWIDDRGLLERFFHPDELGVLHKGPAALESIAVRFAAKEAFGKALGQGLRGISLRNICVKNDMRGKPELVLYGDAEMAFRASGARRIHLSLSHEKKFGIAFVILET